MTCAPRAGVQDVTRVESNLPTSAVIDLLEKLDDYVGFFSVHDF